MRKERSIPRYLLAVLAAVLIASAVGLPVRADEIPEDAYLSGFVGHAQARNLSCESRSAADWAAYLGAAISEEDVLSRLPRSDNPEAGYVGSPDGIWGNVPPRAYGVHAEPVAAVLRDLGVKAAARRGIAWDDLRREVSAGKPVIVWIIGQLWSGTPQDYTAEDGQVVTVARFEHTMVLVGYNASQVHLVDAYTGMTQTYALGAFQDSWSVLGNQAIVYEGEVERPERLPEGSYTVQAGDYLAALAARFAVDWQELAQVNGIAYPYVIFPGQVLKIPGAPPEATSTAAPQPSPTPTPAQAEPARPMPAAGSYSVRSGDTLVSLAARFGVDWQALVDLNGIRFPYFIYPGQALKVPQGAAQSGAAAPAPTAPPAASATPTASPTPATSAAPETYTVQPGDYLMELARRFDLDWQALAELNGIGYPYVIHPGQVLRLR